MRFFSNIRPATDRMAIEVRHDSVRVVVVAASPDSKPRLLHAAHFPMTSDLSDALKQIARELQANQFLCSLLLVAGEYQFVLSDAPNVAAEELKSAMRWRLKDLLDYSVDQASFDVLPIPSDPNKQGRTSAVFLVAAKNTLIAGLQTACETSKIPLQAIDVPELAQRNVLNLFQVAERGVAMLSFDEDGGLFTLSYGGELFLSRRLDVKLAQFQSADEENRQAGFEKVALELQRSLDHFERQYPTITTAKLILAPFASSALLEFRNYLASNLYMPIEILDYAQILDLQQSPPLF